METNDEIRRERVMGTAWVVTIVFGIAGFIISPASFVIAIPAFLVVIYSYLK